MKSVHTLVLSLAAVLAMTNAEIGMPYNPDILDDDMPCADGPDHAKSSSLMESLQEQIRHYLLAQAIQSNQMNAVDDPPSYNAMDDSPSYNAMDDSPSYNAMDDSPSYNAMDDSPSYNAMDDSPSYNAMDDSPSYNAMDDSPSYNAMDDSPSYNAMDDSPSFNAMDDSPSYNAMDDSPSFNAMDDSPSFNEADDSPRFKKKDDHSLYINKDDTIVRVVVLDDEPKDPALERKTACMKAVEKIHLLDEMQEETIRIVKYIRSTFNTISLRIWGGASCEDLDRPELIEQCNIVLKSKNVVKQYLREGKTDDQVCEILSAVTDLNPRNDFSCHLCQRFVQMVDHALTQDVHHVVHVRGVIGELCKSADSMCRSFADDFNAVLNWTAHGIKSNVICSRLAMCSADSKIDGF